MSSARAEDNVTMNEQMMEVLSVAWKEMPFMMGNDWESMKREILAGLANMEGMDDPADDYLVKMLAKMLADYPDVLHMLNEVTHSVTGKYRPEFDVPLPEAEFEEAEPEFEEFEPMPDAAEAEPEFEPIPEAAEAELEFDDGARDFDPTPSAPTVPDDANYYLVPVYFATNRKRDRRYKLQRSFTGRRSNEVTYGLSHVSMPKTHVPGNLEGPSRWRREKADPNRHVLVMSLDVLDQGGFIASANQSLANSEQNEALVYIHGYNVSFGGALRLTAQIATDIGFKGIPITYSWPSFTKTLRYLGDEANIKHGQVFFDEFLELIVRELNVTKIHLLGHSMGNRLLTQGMATISQESLAGKLGQVIFASPDVDKGVFAQRAKKYAGKAERYTLYINESDLALELSQFLHGFARAGERDNDPLVVTPVETIDATNIDSSFLGHNFYQRNRTVLGDIMKLVFENTGPDERENMKPVIGAKRYWEMF